MCIDQSNVLERNHQVELMGRIYSESKSTIAWLGLLMNDSELAMDKMIEFEGLVERGGKHRISMFIEKADGHSDSGSRSEASMQKPPTTFPRNDSSVRRRHFHSDSWLLVENVDYSGDTVATAAQATLWAEIYFTLNISIISRSRVGRCRLLWLQSQRHYCILSLGSQEI
jgi:hypothetical protein